MFLICLALTGGKAQASVPQCATELNGNTHYLSGPLDSRVYEVLGSTTTTINTIINMTDVSVNTLLRCVAGNGSTYPYPFLVIRGGAVCTLILNGNNTLNIDDIVPAIHLDANAKLIISGNGALTMSNSSGYPAIGSGSYQASGVWSDGGWEVVIESGTINIDNFGRQAFTANGALTVNGGDVTIGEFGGGNGFSGSTETNANGSNGGYGGSLTVYGGKVNISSLKGGNGGEGGNATILSINKNGGNGGNGGNAPNVYIYGGTVTLGSILKGSGGAGGSKSGSGVAGTAGAAGGQGVLVIGGGSVNIDVADPAKTSGAVMPAKNRAGGSPVYRQALTLTNSRIPSKNTADQKVVCGRISGIDCQNGTKKGSETSTKYTLNDVKTDASKNVYIWLTPTSSVDTVALAIENCTPHRAIYKRTGHQAQTLNWYDITVTYK